MGSLNVSKKGNASSESDGQKEYEKAEELYDAEKYQESIEWYEKAVELGHVGATNSLGWSYLHGVGVEQDMDKAAELFRKAMAQGNAKAAANLSRMWSGFGYDMDEEEVFRAAKMGAEAEMCWAYAPLADCYYYGTGCDRNVKLAAYWACRSYEHREEEPEAYEVMARFYKEGCFFPKVPSIAKYCYLKLEEMGYDVSWEMGDPELRNLQPVAPIIPEFDDKAPDFFTQECPHSQYLEGIYYLRGYGNYPVDAKKAEELLTKAANQGYAAAQYLLGTKYIAPAGRTEVEYDADGTVLAFTANNQLAISLFREAAKRGSCDAMEAMTTLYFEHIGIKEDTYWWHMRLLEMIFQGYNPSDYAAITADEGTVTILKRIVDVIGVDGLSDGDKVCTMFRELAPDNHKERRRVRMAYSSNAVAVLNSEADKDIAVNEAVRRMMDYSNMSEDIAKVTVLAIYEVLKS